MRFLRQIDLSKNIIHGLIFLFIFLTFSSLYSYNYNPLFKGLDPRILIITTILLILIRKKRGFISKRVLSWIGVGILITGSFICSFLWGPTLPFSLFLIILTPLVTGVLFSTRELIVTSIISGLTMLLTGLYETSYNTTIDVSWRLEPLQRSDVLEYIFAYLLIVLVVVLMNKQFIKAIKRSNSVLKVLKEERDNLESIVKQRTEDITDIYRQQLADSNRLAHYGRVTQGVFHDIGHIASSIHLATQVEDDTENNKKTLHTLSDHLYNLIHSIKENPSNNETFNVYGVCNELKQLISYEANLHNIVVTVTTENESLRLHGNKQRFKQAIHNFLINSIDATCNTEKPYITINITQNKSRKYISIKITDNGGGIHKEVIDSFHALDNNQYNTSFQKGIGLSVSKYLIEKYFNGAIDILSQNHETKVTMIIPNTYDR